jgi:hypothetical protein
MIKKKVLIARDFLRKPLYYCKTVIVLFGFRIEIDYKILPSKPAINKTALNLFLKLTISPLHIVFIKIFIN